MTTLISDLYGKQIITTSGNKLGMVEDVILDFESGTVASLLLVKMDDLVKGKNTSEMIKKNSVHFERVKNVSETIIVSSTMTK
ncbi:PRC-barrel domain-containing protein [Candidatus Marsarchaeota archaeon]|jgi:sporulation protein YlmC with PRC-barrel domain|nr:PRC-barrel domain-containing protein [Candidatus Marsarchaeota archaeon]MCL5092224.1 PRC-barrel domain-containing protein [Candidatus Marsarchaeota archaeon]